MNKESYPHRVLVQYKLRRTFELLSVSYFLRKGINKRVDFIDGVVKVRGYAKTVDARRRNYVLRLQESVESHCGGIGTGINANDLRFLMVLP